MPRQYTPKADTFNVSRILKTCKDIVKEAQEDRRVAIETHDYFKGIVDNREDDTPPNPKAMELMVECLKVAQNSKNNVVKILNLAAKLEEGNKAEKTKASGKGGQYIFDLLEKEAND